MKAFKLLTCFLLASCAAPVVNPTRAADVTPGVDRVAVREGKLTMVVKGESLPMEKAVVLPDDIEVRTNGTFIVGGGKERKLKEGQVLNADGTLLSPDGRLTPVFDHLVMRRGRVVVYKDGEENRPTGVTVLGNGMQVMADGAVTSPTGTTSRLLDGQLMRLDGRAVPVADTITLNQGKVVVQKDGSMVQVRRDASIMMNDGTKVFGNGTVVKKDGSQVTLEEGQIIKVQGVVRLGR